MARRHVPDGALYKRTVSSCELQFSIIRLQIRMGNWYSSRTVSIASGYRNALDESMNNGTRTLKKQQNAIRKPAVITALVRRTSPQSLVLTFIRCQSISAQSY